MGWGGPAFEICHNSTAENAECSPLLVMDRIMARNFEVDILWGGGGGWLDLLPCPRRSLPMGMPLAGPGSISREGGRRNSKYSTESTVQVAVLCQLTTVRRLPPTALNSH